MTFNEAINTFHTWESKSIKKLLVEIEKDSSLKAEILEYYADILNYSGGKNLADIAKIPKNLATKKVRIKDWNPNAKSIEILNHLTIDYMFLWSDDKIPDWIRHTHFRSLGIVEHDEKELVYPISVRELELRGCGLKQVPEIIKEMKIKWVALTESHIENAPDWLFEVVERVDLGKNKIQAIEIETISSINTLRLNGNQITDLAFLSHFPKVDFLDLRNNPISSFPKLQNSILKRIYLSDCKFKEIPGAMNDLKGLTSLFMNNNPITSIPELNLPNLEYLDVSDTPIGKQNKITDMLTSHVEVQQFLKKNASAGNVSSTQIASENQFLEICKMLESRDLGLINKAYKILESSEEDLKKAERRYLKFIQARTGSSATIFDFEKAMLSESEAETMRRTINKSNSSIAMGYLDDEESKLLVDFLGSAVESVVDLEDFKNQLAACSTEEELIAFGETKLAEIKTGIANLILDHKDGWFGSLLFEFTTFRAMLLSLDHTSFDAANCSDRVEAFFVFIQCFAYDDYVIDVFQSDAPNFGAIFWLLPTIPKVIWFDVEPTYPLSPLSFKRYATLNENNQGKRIKSELLSEAKV